MKKIKWLAATLAFAGMCTFSSCNKNQDKNLSPDHPEKVTPDMISENGANPDEASIRDYGSASAPDGIATQGQDRPSGHYLYTESNGAEKNHILIYEIKYNGDLQHAGKEASGGEGTGAPLGSQSGIALDSHHEWLFAVNAGSNSVSTFRVHNDGSLSLENTENSYGKTPVSLCVYGNLLYVLNRGSDNIHGFRITGNGKLKHIEGSTQPLSGTGVDAPQIAFSPDGDFVIVTEKATNKIGTFRVKNNGAVSPGNFNASVGNTPFGFDFARDHFMIVSNAEGGAAGAGSGTSYLIRNNGNIWDINGARPDYQAAPCWVATTEYGRFAYMTNTASNNISSYYVAPWGGLYLIESNAAETGMSPLDIVVAANNFFVYVLNAKSHNITQYYRQFLGKLHWTGSTENLPAGATGLATF